MKNGTRKISENMVIKLLIIMLVVALILTVGYAVYLSGALDKDPVVETQAMNCFDKTLTVAADEDYWPYVFYDEDGQLSGHDVELINIVANRLEMNLEIIATSWEDSLQLAQDGKVDAVLTCEYGDSEAMGGYLIMTTPTDSEKFVVFGKEKIDRLDEAIGKRIGLMINGNAVNAIKAQGMDKWCVEYDSNRAAFEALADDECDYVIVRYDIGRGILKNMGTRANGIKPFVYLSASNMCIGVEASRTELAQRINEVTIEMRNDGTVKNLNNKWLTNYLGESSFASLQSQHPWIVFLTLLIFFAAVIGIIALLLERKREKERVSERLRNEIAAAELKARDEREKELKTQMARVMELSDDFQAICDTDIETGKYEIFSYNSEYSDAILTNMAKGDNFYADAHKDSETVVYSEDKELVKNTFGNKEYIKKTLDEKGEFTVDYRMLNDGEPVWYRIKAVKKAGDESHFLVGVFCTDEERRQEDEYLRTIERGYQVIEGLANEYYALYRLNLDDNTYELFELGAEADDIRSTVKENTNFTKILQHFADAFVHEEDKEKVYFYSDSENIRNALKDKKSERILIRRNFDGSWKWVEMNMVKAEKEEVLAKYVILGFADRDERERRESETRQQLEITSVLSTMAEDFDYIAAVNRAEKTVIRYWMADKYKDMDKMVDKSLPSNERLDRFFNLIVHPDDMNLFREKADYDTVIAELDKHPSYKFEVRSLFDGREEYYRIKFAYKADDHNIVIIGILNIDEQVRREMENAVLQERAELDSQVREQMARVMSLTDNLQAIYDVDVESGDYDVFSYNSEFAEYVLDRNEIRTSFYEDSIKDTDIVVYPEDRELIRNTTGSRDYLKEQLSKQGGCSVDYRLINGDGFTWYRVKIIKKAGDDNRCLIGVFNIDDSVRAEKEQQQRLTDQMGRVMELSDDFQAIFDVDMETGEYEIFSYDSAYFDDVLVKMEKGINFYADTLKDVEKVVYPEDRDLIRDTFSNREYIRKTLAEKGQFTIDYRLLSDNGPVWYRVRVVKKSGESGRFLVGVFYVDESIRKEAEYKRSIEQELKIINGLASDCVSLYTVDLEHNTYKVYSITNEVDDIKTVIEDFSDLSNSLRQYADGYVHEEDRELLYYYADLDNMRKALENTRSQKCSEPQTLNIF